MTKEEAIEIINNEILCVKMANVCDRDCGNCALVRPDIEILEAYNMAIEALKKESLKWIPASEQMPSPDQYEEPFILTVRCEHVDGYPDIDVCVADWTPHGWEPYQAWWGVQEGLAWMPLPSPYKMEEHNE